MRALSDAGMRDKETVGFLVVGLLILAGIGGLLSNLSATQIAQYAANAGFTGDDLVTAVAIALAESSGNPNADNTADPGGSIGLWQIDRGYHPEFAGEDLTDPQTNANAAFSVYSAAGNSFSPWSTFKNGAYQAHIAEAQNAVNS